MREWILGILLAAAGSLVAVGAFLVFVPAGFVVGGVALALWSWFVLTDSGA